MLWLRLMLPVFSFADVNQRSLDVQLGPTIAQPCYKFNFLGSVQESSCLTLFLLQICTSLVKSDCGLMAPSLCIICIIKHICRQPQVAGTSIKSATSSYLQRHALALQLLHPSCDAVIGLVIFVIFIKRESQKLSIFHLSLFCETS